MVVASLCHDIGKAISVPGHPQIAAAILKPYVRPEVHKMILVHQDFQGAHYYHHFGGDPNAREKHRDALTAEEWKLAEQFADEWDQKAFDPDYDTLPLEHFEDRVRTRLRQRQALLRRERLEHGGHAVVEVATARHLGRPSSSTTGWALPIAMPRPAHCEHGEVVVVVAEGDHLFGRRCRDDRTPAACRRPCRRRRR